MSLLDWLSWIIKALLGNRKRSVLTLSGIAIGIASVALLTSIGEGLRLYLLDSFSQFGTRIVAVTPGKVTTQGIPGMLKSIKPLTIDDAERLRDIPFVEQVVPLVGGTGRIEAGELARDSDIFGVGHEAAKAWKMEVALGRFLPSDNPQAPRAYAVLGQKMKQELFGLRNPLGELVRVGEMRFRVVGVMEPKGQFLGFDLDDVIYIPTHLALQLFNQESLMEVDVVFSEQSTSTEISRRISERLEALHGSEDFTLFTQEDMLSSLDKILGLLTLAVAGLGGVSLLIGGVGVLTIMTISLRERTSEIGLLCALGCTRDRILLLFLGEAICLATVGGLAGLTLVVALVLFLQGVIPGLPLALNSGYLMAALLLSSLIGLVAGIAPAVNASRRNPIEALRDE
ncbi:MAG: ABC transporter permease [Pseudomonadales bacterium]